MDTDGLSTTFHKVLQKSQGVSEYDARRAQCVQREHDTAWDAAATRMATPAAKAAAQIVHDIREHERQHLFGDCASEAIPGPETRDLGGKFLVNWDRINKSRLFDIVLRMPKGANLHLHFNAGLHPENFVARARGMKTMFIRSTVPLLHPADLEKAEIVFKVMQTNTPTTNIFASEYMPAANQPDSRPWMSWIQFCNEFPKQFYSSAEAFILRKMELSADDVYDKKQTANGIWARFNQITRCFKGLFNYESAYRWYVSALVEHFVAERIMYAELRPMLLDKTIPTDDGLNELDHSAQMRILVEEVQKTMTRHGWKSSKFLGFKIVYCTPRSVPVATMQRELVSCIRLKQEFPDLICGFDLVGAEDRPNSIHFYRAELLAFQETCDQLGLEIPFLFHAGETLLDTGGSSDPDESNLYDALLLKSRRIGHGNALIRHGELVDRYRDADIAIEVCMISNEILHMCSNAKQHSLPALLARGLPCALASDNPSLFSSSMSHDFYQALTGMTTMTLHGMYQLAVWSIEYSCLSKDDKSYALDVFKVDWEEFCNWVGATYSNRVSD